MVLENPINGSTDVGRLRSRLTAFRETLRKSPLLESIFLSLKNRPFTAIRCLALGSPSDSPASVYQLAYLLEIAGHFEIPKDAVSLYDPVFAAADNALFDHYGLLVEETHTPRENTLYFLPHAPLDLTESLILEREPLLVLANDMVAHTERMSKKKLHDQYRHLSLLVHLVEEKEAREKEEKKKEAREKEEQKKDTREKEETGKPQPEETPLGKANESEKINHQKRLNGVKNDEIPPTSLTYNGASAENTSSLTENGPESRRNDGFVPVRRKKRSRAVFVPSSIDYDYSGAYFSDMSVVRCIRAEGPWGNAFTDLALHVISKKSQ